jgi:transposase-like protein
MIFALPRAQRANANAFPLVCEPMVHRITVESNFLRAELFGRETMKDTTAFLDVVTRESRLHGRSNILIYVHSSAPIFHVEHHGFIDSFKEIAKTPGHQIALLADTKDLQISHEYLELRARQYGLNVRNFRDEASALRWLRDHRGVSDRRQQQERREVPVRRLQSERRQRMQRGSVESSI